MKIAMEILTVINEIIKICRKSIEDKLWRVYYFHFEHVIGVDRDQYVFDIIH